MRLNQCHDSVDVHILSYRDSVDAWVLEHLDELNDCRPTNDQLQQIHQCVQREVPGTYIHRFMGLRTILAGVIAAVHKVSLPIQATKKEEWVEEEAFHQLMAAIKKTEDLIISRVYITMVFPGHVPVFMMHIPSGYIHYRHGTTDVHGLLLDTVNSHTINEWSAKHWTRLRKL